MNWQEVLVILVPILGLLAWAYNRIDRKFDYISREIKEIKDDVKEVKRDVYSIRDRLTKLEGRFEERGYWESRKRTGTEGE